MSKLEPLELKRAILDAVDGGITSVGGGQRIFPYGAVEIRLLARDSSDSGRLRAVFVNNGLLEAAIHDLLSPPRCERSEPLVRVVLVKEVKGPDASRGFEVEFIYDTFKARDAAAHLEVLEGLANRRQFRLQHRETFIGRCEQPAKDGRVLRKNDLYFLDPREEEGRMSKELRANQDVNQSVSRLHAHISYQEKDDSYYVYDDESIKGTRLLRGGRGVAEDVDRYVGKVLGDGDVLCFGKAKVRFKLVKRGERHGSGEDEQPPR